MMIALRTHAVLKTNKTYEQINMVYDLNYE